MFGTNKDMAAPKPDVEGAKKLLAEAGYTNGFALDACDANDRYINDAQISQAVAQMLTRVGLKVSLDAMTAEHSSSPSATRREFGFWLAGWGSDTGEMSSPLKALIATPNEETGMGATDPGGYPDPRSTRRCRRLCDGGRRQARRAAAPRAAAPRWRISAPSRCISR